MSKPTLRGMERAGFSEAERRDTNLTLSVDANEDERHMEYSVLRRKSERLCALVDAYRRDKARHK